MLDATPLGLAETPARLAGEGKIPWELRSLTSRGLTEACGQQSERDAGLERTVSTYLIAIKLGINPSTSLAAMRQAVNLTPPSNGARDAACLTSTQLNLARHTASSTNELTEHRASPLDATADSELEPLRQSSVDARDKLGDVNTELLLAFRV